jgi:hypothetical protein
MQIEFKLNKINLMLMTTDQAVLLEHLPQNHEPQTPEMAAATLDELKLDINETHHGRKYN